MLEFIVSINLHEILENDFNFSFNFDSILVTLDILEKVCPKENIEVNK
tara:strand:- start:221 stop:364 length:144 start_codon:yes stop_codon:yes gene_type:complete